MPRTRLLSPLLLAGLVTLSACAPETSGPEPRPEDPPAKQERPSPSSSQSAPSPEPVEAPEVERLRIGISADLPGLGELEDGGRPEGFDAEVARGVADRLEVSEREIDWVPVLPGERDRVLADEEVDLLVASYSITDERQKTADFAGPYLVARQDLLVRSEDQQAVDSLDDLDGRRVCVAEGSTAGTAVREEAPESASVVEQLSLVECVVYLESGYVDAVAGDDVVLAALVKDGEREGTMALAGVEDEAFAPQRYGIGMPADSDLCPAVAESVQRMRESGQRDRLLEAATTDTGYTPDEEANSGEDAELVSCPSS